LLQFTILESRILKLIPDFCTPDFGYNGIYLPCRIHGQYERKRTVGFASEEKQKVKERMNKNDNLKESRWQEFVAEVLREFFNSKAL
jgi:hypothetical protein